MNSDINVRMATLERNPGVTIGRVTCEACCETWNLGTNSVFALGTKKTKDNFDSEGPSGRKLTSSQQSGNLRFPTN
jgi:hypothetical protein